MKLLAAVTVLLAGCNSVMAQCEIELQVTDHPEAKYRAQKICKKEGYTGAIEKTLCRSKNPLDKDNLPAACK